LAETALDTFDTADAKSVRKHEIFTGKSSPILILLLFY